MNNLNCMREVCSLPNVLPSSTNPTRPFTVNTIEARRFCAHQTCGQRVQAFPNLKPRNPRTPVTRSSIHFLDRLGGSGAESSSMFRMLVVSWSAIQASTSPRPKIQIVRP